MFPCCSGSLRTRSEERRDKQLEAKEELEKTLRQNDAIREEERVRMDAMREE